MATKKARLESESTEVDPTFEKILEEMEKIQNQMDEIQKKKEQELIAIECNHQKERRPIYQRRNLLCEKIPNFWSTAFQNHPVLKSLLAKNEIQLLNFLKELDVETLDTKNSLRVTLKFNENPFLQNLTLWKEIRYQDSDDEPVITASEIKWNPGMDLTQNGSSNKEEEESDEIQDSFFSYFQSSDDGHDYDPTELALIIRDELWADPVPHYLGLSSDDVDGEEPDEDDEGDEDDEDEDDEE
eukprot:TRINITY_DN1658_c0_g1_i1.p1 TRINITY_DN1658_c0_g1~~TRINITY_DN1658_c0_g1_i1.p1  ORF type:complete len:266 (-),score=105.68 TRINITY_DN1658_c0_g1_i1:75-800(-)